MIRHAPAPAASNTRVAGLNPYRALISDLVLTMSQDHIFYVQAHHERTNVRALAEYVGMGKDDVPDPFGGSRKDYVRCRDHLKKLIEALVRRLDRDGTP